MTTPNVKKAFVELYTILEANQNKKVSTIMAELLEVMTAKSGGGSNGVTFRKDEEGNVTHVFCYYHKKWEAISECEYGAKKNTATGLNTMCKEGVSNWTKQQRAYKVGKEKLLESLASGAITTEDLPTKLEELEEAKDVIVPREDGHGEE